MADKLVLDLIVRHDRPFNVQAVSDLLATSGVKKAQAQRSLDTLAAASKLRVKVTPAIWFGMQKCVLAQSELRRPRHLLAARLPPRARFRPATIRTFEAEAVHAHVQEFGKTKIYFPVHDEPVLSKEVRPFAAPSAALLQQSPMFVGPAMISTSYIVCNLQELAQKQAMVKQLASDAAEQQEALKKLNKGASVCCYALCWSGTTMVLCLMDPSAPLVMKE
jgi:hypothetical protein